MLLLLSSCYQRKGKAVKVVNTDSRRVIAFFAVGLLAAVAIGFLVWRVSVPNTTLANDSTAIESSSNIEATSEEESTTSSSSSESETTSSSRDNEDDQRPAQPQRQEPAQPYAQGEDPFLAPNAVVNSGGQAAEPTRYYRPDSLSDQQPAQPTQPQQQPVQPQPTQRPTTQEPTPSSQQPEPSGEDRPTVPAEQQSDEEKIEVTFPPGFRPGTTPGSSAELQDAQETQRTQQNAPQENDNGEQRAPTAERDTTGGPPAPTPTQ